MQPEREPVHRPQTSRNQQSEDAEDDALASELIGDRFAGTTAKQGLSSPWLKLGGAVMLAAVAYWGFGTSRSTGDETSHENWSQHVVELNQIYESTGSGLVKFVAKDGTTELGTDLRVEAADSDSPTSDKVLQALSSGNDQEAMEALQEAQQIPEPASDPDDELTLKPTISTGLRDAVLSGDAKFYHLFLFDSCDEDGDVVDVHINGEIFARVPITHAGATLSIPIGSATTVEIVGFRDGEGGITVACESSQGEFFMRALAVGESQPLAMVR